MTKSFLRRLLIYRLQRPPPELKNIIFLNWLSNYSAGLATVNSTSGPSATPQERSIFRPVGWVETFGPLIPAIAFFQRVCLWTVGFWQTYKDVMDRSLHLLHRTYVLCRPLPLRRTRALWADPYRFTARARCVQTRAAKIHVACKGGMASSYVAPVSPHVRAAQILAAKIHVAPGQ